MTPAVVRTVVPYVVGFILYWIGQALLVVTGAPVDLTNLSEPLTQIVTITLGGVYYIVIRYLERNHGDKWGWFLGLADQPRYDQEVASIRRVASR